MSRRNRSFLFDNISGKLLTDVSFTLKQISDQVEGSQSVATVATSADVKTALSVVDSGGDGSISYNSETGVITYTGPSSSEVRAHFSAGTGISITGGQIATTITQYADSNARASISVTDSGGDGSLSYNSGTGVITYTGPGTSDYRAAFSAGTGITITSGAIATTITQYTDALARSAVSAGTGLSYNSTTGVFTNTITQYTDSLARAAISAGTGISYNNTTGVVSTTITQYTDALARSAVSVTDSGGDGSLSYNNTTGVITYTGPGTSDYRAAFSAGTGVTITNGVVATTITQYTDSLARAAISITDGGGDGSLSYNNTTGVITYTGPSASDVRAHFTAGTGITITSGQVAVDTSTIATKTYADSAASAAVAAVIDSAPAALDTLNELAAALGDDANYSTTVSTALGNRLRVDVNNQSLTSTQQGNALTNLGITATNTELNYVDGVTSAIQTQIDAKAPSASPTFTGTVTLPSATSIGTVSSTEIGYLDGVTSAIQTQIDAKAPSASPTFTGTVTLPSDTSVGNVSSTELGYLDGVTSAIQTQINSKAPTANPTFSGTVSLPSTTSIGTVSSTELGYLDGVTSAIQTQLDNKQASSSYLTTIAGLDRTDGNFIVANGTTWVAESGGTVRDSLGVGTSNNVQFNSFGVGTGASGTTGEIRATNNVTAYYSDDRLKTRLGVIENALEKINSLTGFYYEANETAQDLGYKVRREVGLSAQDVERVLPEIVTDAPIDSKYKTIWYERVIPLVVEAIKELHKEVLDLKNSIKE